MSDFITEDSVLEQAELQFGRLLQNQGGGGGGGFLDHTADLLMSRRLSGLQTGRGAQAMLVTAARAAARAHAQGLCTADTLAASARCLGEAGLLSGELQVRSWEKPG